MYLYAIKPRVYSLPQHSDDGQLRHLAKYYDNLADFTLGGGPNRCQ
jgi:hypothetical protein